MDNIVGALERSDRVDKIELFDVTCPSLENFSAAMQELFSELICLPLLSIDEIVQALPNSFLVGPAPCLRTLWL
jgi:hypothetical protein